MTAGRERGFTVPSSCCGPGIRPKVNLGHRTRSRADTEYRSRASWRGFRTVALTDGWPSKNTTATWCSRSSSRDDLLFEGDDLLLEPVDVGGCAESGCAPGLFNE